MVQWHYNEGFEPILPQLSRRFVGLCTDRQSKVSPHFEQHLVRAVAFGMQQELCIKESLSGASVALLLRNRPGDFVDIDSAHDPYDDLFWHQFEEAAWSVHSHF